MVDKITFQLKAPDCIDAILQQHLADDPERLDQVRKHFFKWGEYCTIELDLTTMTGKVIPV